MNIKMNDFRIPISLGLIIFICSGCSFRKISTNQKHHPKPNIILFFTDDQGYNDLGCYGSKDIKTPNFDKMANEGTKFTSFYAQPVCGPSRAALMTGSYPLRIAEPKNMKEENNGVKPRLQATQKIITANGDAVIREFRLAQRSTSYWKAPKMKYGPLK